VIDTTTSSVEATRGLGRTVAEMTRPGDLVLLAGDLGAGKTAFTQGFAEGLGVTDPVTSPTFTLAHRYEGRIRLHHLDVYRLEQAEEIADLDVPELLDDDAVTIIEWGDAIRAALPADYLEVRLAFGDGDDDRVVTMIPVGPSWAAREHGLRERTADGC
jgi:tRNA threonylcarbamoyladenosine biosynthesis protein TsaE